MREQKEVCIDHPPTWAALAAVFLIAVLVIVVSIEHPTSAFTGSAVQKLNFMKPGDILHLEVKGIPGVSQAKIDIKDYVKDSIITFDKVDDIDFTGNSFVKFRVASADAVALGNMLITLKLRESDLVAKGIAVSDVRLFANGKELPTTNTKIVDGYYYYKATSTELGDFVIGRVMKAPEVIAEPVNLEPVDIQPVDIQPVDIQPVDTQPVDAGQVNEKVQPVGEVIDEAQEPQEQEPQGLLARFTSFLRRFFYG
jgi:hypothetical protein